MFILFYFYIYIYYYMNKCALVIPLHPKHYNYGYYIYNELINSDDNLDFYFIFTDNNDKDLFLKNIKIYNKSFNYLVLSNFADLNIVNKTNSFVSIKKFYALHALHKKYDYISCIDSEIYFLNKTNFYDMMKNVINNKTIVGGLINENMHSEKKIVMDSLLALVDNSYHEKLRQISFDFRAYTWWSNIPVYDCKIVQHFLDWISFNNNNLERFNWHIFDDFTYNFFCILFYDYQLKVISNYPHSLEFANSNLVEYINDNLCKLYWVNNKAYNQNKSYYENNNFKIVFHLDRWPNL